MFNLILAITKTFSRASRLLNIGSGYTWSGHIILFFYPHFIEEAISSLPQGTIIITGTNGKTTTAQALSFILRERNLRVVTNTSGANLLNGIASALISKMGWRGQLHADIGVFEVDEAVFPEAVRLIQPTIIVLLNLFRDQLDRYGEVDTLVSKWKDALEGLPSSVKILINANDPALAFLGEHSRGEVFYFGVTDHELNLKEVPHYADSRDCLNCNSVLSYKVCYFSHIGIWFCPVCKRTTPPLSFEAGSIRIRKEEMHFSINKFEITTKLVGLYNVYNLSAVFGLTQLLGMGEALSIPLFKNFEPHFGRQETFLIAGQTVKILLSKNPTGFNVNLRLISVIFEPGDRLLLALNDGIADGRDVSWIYDVDFEDFLKLFEESVYVSGSRADDLALRLKYAGLKKEPIVSKNTKIILEELFKEAGKRGTLYILPTYTALLSIRKVLLGKEIS